MPAKMAVIRAGGLLAFRVFSRGCYVPRAKMAVIRAEIGVDRKRAGTKLPRNGVTETLMVVMV